MIYVVLYLVSIVLANLSVAKFGPSVAVINAFLFIGLDLTIRDKLHETWKKSNLVLKMGLLILAGSALSWVLNRNAGQIAVASFAAFSLSAVVDTIVYHRLMNYQKLIRINGSNIPSAAVDSIVFPAIAFGFPLLIPIVLGQFMAKVGGGFVWSVIIQMVTKNKRD